jgi:Cyclin-dependent kinase inhibitor 3 (CDKN3)
VFTPPADYSCAEIIPGLYVGAFPPPGGLGVEAGIDVLVSLTDSRPAFDGVVIHHPLVDNGVVRDPDALRTLARRICHLLADARSVLVHCRLGLDRSPLVAALVLIQLGWTPSDAIDHIRLARPGALGAVGPGLWGRTGKRYAAWLLEHPSVRGSKPLY